MNSQFIPEKYSISKLNIWNNKEGNLLRHKFLMRSVCPQLIW